MTVQEILSRLERVSKAHSGWMARCPAHEDARPSLSVGAAEDGRVLLRCFAGCDLAAILGALRIEVRDLFPDQSSMASASRLGEPVTDGLVELQRPSWNVIAGSTDHSIGRAKPRSGPVECLAMLGRDAGSSATFQNGMDGNDMTLIENADHVG